MQGVNIKSRDMSLYTKWEMQDFDPGENEPVFSLSGNPGSSVTLTANKPGKSTIKISNKKSENSLSINAKCGNLYEWTDNYIVYITTEEDVINITKGENKVFAAALENTSQTGSFGWILDNGTSKNDFLEITGMTGGTCNIKAVEAGQTILKISNSLCPGMDKEILVNIANSQEELKGYRYLSTKNNVITVSEGNSVSVNVEIKNSDNVIVNGYSWLPPDNPSVADVNGSGNIAVIKGIKCGTTRITVENHEYCDYPLTMIVNVVDPVLAADNPYISC